MDLVPDNRECELFREDLTSGWQKEKIPECPWNMTVEHLNELYDLYGVGSVRNVLSLRLFASSIFEVAAGPPNSQKLMNTVFGEDFIRKIASNNRQIYEAIEQTTQHLAWKIRKAQILIFRRSSPNHGWESVRKILIEILKTGNTSEALIGGMTASILQEVAEANPKTWREDAALLSRHRFPDIFRFAVFIFNDTIGECLRNVRGEIVYEAVAARLCYFYARLAADTWRILVIRNGPKEATEWLYIHRYVEPKKLAVFAGETVVDSDSGNPDAASDSELSILKICCDRLTKKGSIEKGKLPKVLELAKKDKLPKEPPIKILKSKGEKVKQPIDPNLFDENVRTSSPAPTVRSTNSASKRHQKLPSAPQQKPANHALIFSKQVDSF